MILKKKSGSTAGKGNLITYTHPDSEIAEQYRSIYSHIQFLPDKKPETLMITSPKFGEGKSMVTANLAISIARQGEKVLVIDADLRKPTLHFMFKVENKIGLTDVLDGKILMKEAVNKTAIKRLDLLTSGDIPINSTELLSSELMKQLMEEAAIDYDIVLFDTPPVLKVADTSILANQCDSVILVVKYGKTESEKALEAKTLLERARAKVLGIILNGKS